MSPLVGSPFSQRCVFTSGFRSPSRRWIVPYPLSLFFALLPSACDSHLMEPSFLAATAPRAAESPPRSGPYADALAKVLQAADDRVETMRSLMVDTEIQSTRLEATIADLQVVADRAMVRAVDAETKATMAVVERETMSRQMQLLDASVQRLEADKLQLLGRLRAIDERWIGAEQRAVDAERAATAAGARRDAAEDAVARANDTIAELTSQIRLAELHAEELESHVAQAKRETQEKDVACRTSSEWARKARVEVTQLEDEIRATRQTVATLEADIAAVALASGRDRSSHRTSDDPNSSSSNLLAADLRLLVAELRGSLAVAQMRESDSERRFALYEAHVEVIDRQRRLAFEHTHSVERRLLQSEQSRDLLHDRLELLIGQAQEAASLEIARLQKQQVALHQQDTADGRGAAKVLAPIQRPPLQSATASGDWVNARLIAALEASQLRVLDYQRVELYRRASEALGDDWLTEVQRALGAAADRATAAERIAVRCIAGTKAAESQATLAQSQMEQAVTDEKAGRSAVVAAKAQWEAMAADAAAAKKQAAEADERRGAFDVICQETAHRASLESMRRLAAERQATRSDDARRRAESRAEVACAEHAAMQAEVRKAMDAVAAAERSARDSSARLINAEAFKLHLEAAKTEAELLYESVENAALIAMRRAVEAEKLSESTERQRRHANEMADTAERRIASADMRVAEAMAAVSSMEARMHAVVAEATERQLLAEPFIESLDRLHMQQTEMQLRIDALRQQLREAEMLSRDATRLSRAFEQEAIAAQRCLHEMATGTEASKRLEEAQSQLEVLRDEVARSAASLTAITLERDEWISRHRDVAERQTAQARALESCHAQLEASRREVSAMGDHLRGVSRSLLSEDASLLPAEASILSREERDRRGLEAVEATAVQRWLLERCSVTESLLQLAQRRDPAVTPVGSPHEGPAWRREIESLAAAARLASEQHQDALNKLLGAEQEIDELKSVLESLLNGPGRSGGTEPPPAGGGLDERPLPEHAATTAVAASPRDPSPAAPPQAAGGGGVWISEVELSTMRRRLLELDEPASPRQVSSARPPAADADANQTLSLTEPAASCLAVSTTASSVAADKSSLPMGASIESDPTALLSQAVPDGREASPLFASPPLVHSVVAPSSPKSRTAEAGGSLGGRSRALTAVRFVLPTAVPAAAASASLRVRAHRRSVAHHRRFQPDLPNLSLGTSEPVVGNVPPVPSPPAAVVVGDALSAAPPPLPGVVVPLDVHVASLAALRESYEGQVRDLQKAAARLSSDKDEVVTAHAVAVAAKAYLQREVDVSREEVGRLLAAKTPPAAVLSASQPPAPPAPPPPLLEPAPSATPTGAQTAAAFAANTRLFQQLEQARQDRNDFERQLYEAQMSLMDERGKLRDAEERAFAGKCFQVWAGECQRRGAIAVEHAAALLSAVSGLHSDLVEAALTAEARSAAVADQLALAQRQQDRGTALMSKPAAVRAACCDVSVNTMETMQQSSCEERRPSADDRGEGAPVPRTPPNCPHDPAAPASGGPSAFVFRSSRQSNNNPGASLTAWGAGGGASTGTHWAVTSSPWAQQPPIDRARVMMPQRNVEWSPAPQREADLLSPAAVKAAAAWSVDRVLLALVDDGFDGYRTIASDEAEGRLDLARTAIMQQAEHGASLLAEELSALRGQRHGLNQRLVEVRRELATAMISLAELKDREEAAVGESRRAQAAEERLLRENDELQEKATEATIAAMRAPLREAEHRDAIWREFGESQRTTMTTAAAIQRQLSLVDERNRELEKHALLLERKYAEAVREGERLLTLKNSSAAIAAANEARVQEVEAALAQRESQMSTMRDDAAVACRRAASAMEVVEALQARIKDLENSVELKRFQEQQSAVLVSASGGGAGGPGYFTPFVIRHDVGVQATAALDAAGGDGGLSPPPTHAATSPLRAPKRSDSALALSDALVGVAAALHNVAEQRQAEGRRIQEEELRVALEEGAPSVLALRDALRTRAAQLQRFEIELSEARERVVTFHETTQARLALLGRQEREARFEAQRWREDTALLYRGVRLLVGSRRRLLERSRALEAHRMEGADRGVASRAVQTGAGDT